MPIFGDNTSGGDTFPSTNDRCIVSAYTLIEAGTATQINVLYDATTTAGCNSKGVIYADSGGLPGALVIASAGVAIPGGGGDIAHSISPTALAAGTYWIGSVVDSFQAVWSGEPTGGGLQRKEAHTYASPANPFGTPSGSGGMTVDAYVTYASITSANGNNGASDTTVATGTTLNVSAGNLLIAIVTTQENGIANRVSTVTDGGSNSLTKVVEEFTLGAYSSIWYKENAAANAAATFTATVTANTRYKVITVLNISGGLLSGALASSQAGFFTGTTSGSLSSSLTVPSGTAIYVGGGVSTNDRTWTADTGFTEVYDSLETSTVYSHETQYIIGTGTKNITFTINTASNADLTGAAFYLGTLTQIQAMRTMNQFRRRRL